MDRFLASANRIKTITRAVINIEADDAVISKVKAKDAKGARWDSTPRGCKPPSSESKTWATDGNAVSLRAAGMQTNVFSGHSLGH